jgi:DNA-binding transcriptional LysR family regulator
MPWTFLKPIARMSNIPQGDVQMKHDLNLIRVLVAIADTRRVASAAALLDMSQPGVSNALRRLRQSFGDVLFVRTATGMMPTPLAIPLISAGREILTVHATKMLKSPQFDCATTDTEFRFAMSDVGEMVFLPRIRLSCHREAPHASLRSVSLSPNALGASLEDGRVDLAVGYFPDLRGNNCFQQKLFSHSFVCLVRSGNPIVGKRLTANQFLEMEHAVVHAESRSQEMFERFLTRQGMERRVALRVSHYTSIPFVIANSDLVVTVPLAVGVSFAAIARLRLLKPPFDVPRFDIKQHWHRRVHQDPRNRWLRTQVEALFRGAAHEWREPAYS